MGGIEAAEEMTPDQLDALSGGELLRQEASSFTQVPLPTLPAGDFLGHGIQCNMHVLYARYFT